MSKHSGAMCTELGCRDNPLFWCERNGPNPSDCTDGGQGDFNMAEIIKLPIEEFRKVFELSKTKFRLDRKQVFVEVGLFAAAGCMVGDKLIAVAHRGLTHSGLLWEYKEQAERENILKWSFDANVVSVLFERGDLQLWATMSNPAYKG